MELTQTPPCQIKGCQQRRIYRNTIHPYCEMHKARRRRNGHFGLRDKRFHGLEKLSHAADPFIRDNAHRMQDSVIARELQRQKFANATIWTVKYRRRKLGIKKYESGEKRKHKAWIRQQALQKYGSSCELCGYSLFVETHHILPKHKGGPHEVANLMIVCSNCHTMLTRRYVRLSDRSEISVLCQRVVSLVRSLYPYFG